MRKLSFALMAVVLLFGLSLNAYCEKDDEWRTGRYVDEFNEPTGESYASIRTVGTFSDTASHNEQLDVQIIVDWNNVEFYLLEYGKLELVNIIDRPYIIRIKDNDDEVHEFSGYLDDSTHRIVVLFPNNSVTGSNSTREEILTIFSNGGDIRFSITQDSKVSSQYVFSIHADNFDLMRKKSSNIAVNYLGATSEGIVPIVFNDKMGAMTLHGDIVIPCQYDVVSECSDGMIRVYKGEFTTLDGGMRTKNGEGKYGFMTKDGEMVVDCIYDGAYNFSDGFAFVKQNGKWGAIDKQGQRVIPFEYDYVKGTSEGIASVYKGELNRGVPAISGGKYCFIDKTGAVISGDYDDANPFKEGFAVVQTKGKYGYIDKTGELVISAKYDAAQDFSEGKAFVKYNDNYYIINANGNRVAQCKMKAENIKFIGLFRDGMAYVLNKDYRYGFINKKGREVIPCQYRFMRDFKDGYAPVENEEEKWGIIDKKGDIAVPFKYDEINRCGDYYSVRTYASKNANGIGIGGIYGLIDAKGNELLESKYLQLRYGDGYYTLSTDDVWYILDKDLKQIFPTVRSNEESILSGIIPEDSIWGIAADDLKQTYDAEYKPCSVDGDEGWSVAKIGVGSYNMDVYYIFGEEGLFKIAYILNDSEGMTQSELKQCYQTMVKEMKKTEGEPDSVKKNVSIWKKANMKIEIGSGKMKKYTGLDNPTAGIVFKYVP